MANQTIKSWLDESTTILRDAGIPSARLDAEIILAHTLKKPRTWLHMYRDEPLEDRAREIANARIDLRSDFTPIAYIVGHREFYGRLFTITPNVLIPSPESEALIELATSLDLPENATAIDVGTGSGALAITLALEIRRLTTIFASDVSAPALVVAQKNARQHRANNIQFQKSDLLDLWRPLYAQAPLFDLIVANLPYVDRAWQTSPEVRHEPALALFAEQQGLKLIFHLLEQSQTALKTGGFIILESDPHQHQAIIQKAENLGLSAARTLGYGLLLTK